MRKDIWMLIILLRHGLVDCAHLLSDFEAVSRCNGIPHMEGHQRLKQRCGKMALWQMFVNTIRDPTNRVHPLLPPKPRNRPLQFRGKSNNSRFLRVWRKWSEDILDPNLPFSVVDTPFGIGLKRSGEWEGIKKLLYGELVRMTPQQHNHLVRRKYSSMVKVIIALHILNMYSRNLID